MVKFILVRILQAIPTLFVIATLTFFMTRLAPGGPFDSEKNIPVEIKEKLEAHFGLEKPLYEQYFLYLGNLLQGDLGPSFKYMGWEVSELIAKAFPVSAQLGLFSLLIALVLRLAVINNFISASGTITEHMSLPSRQEPAYFFGGL